jgi:shikimate dehydrogenase
LGNPGYNHPVFEPFAQPINAATRYCAVFGHPVKHSASPAMQNAGIAELGLNWRYLAFEVHPDDLRGALEGARLMNFIGVNLTLPHKLLGVDFMDVLDESAKTWGAVNTVRFEGRDASGNWLPLRQFEKAPRQIRSHGFNTDADAVIRSLREDLGQTVAGARIVILGAGGAGRTAALKLGAEGAAELYLVNRTVAKAQAVANELRAAYPKSKLIVDYPASSTQVDLVLNATSLGLRAEDPLPFDQGRLSLKKVSAVYDMIYRPAETAFLGMAKASGCRVANGLGMLLYQGAKALELWTGQTAPVAKMREALQKNVYGK